MLGRDHALSGALAFTAAAPLLHVTGAHLAAAIALTAGAGVLPDIDEPGSTIARTFGFLTGTFAWIVHQISGGHRKGTHSLVGVALVTAASLAAGIVLAALVIWNGWDVARLTSWHVPVLAVCVALGMLAHIAGDMCTHDGCPLLYPLSRHEFGLLPEPIRITTNKLAEHWIISPLLLAGLAYFLWRDAGPTLLTAGPG